MRKFRWTTWLAATIGAAIVVGCVSEIPDQLAGDKASGDAARPLTDPTGGNGPRGNGNVNDNGAPGPCDPACPDIDGNGVVDLQDLSYLLGAFGGAPNPPCTDTDGNGIVDLQDLANLLGAFGTSCNANGNGNGNANDNGAGNTNDNGAGNTNDNGAGNTNDNGAGNTNDNGGGGGDCPDGSTQLEANLSDGGDAEYRLLVGGCARFRVRTDNAPPETTLPVTINGVIVGTLMTDDDGRGELRYDTSDGNFPPGFPAVQAGDVVGVGGSVSGVLLRDCSDNSNCNG